MSYNVWRDTPKRGETDAQWCFAVYSAGHWTGQTGCNFPTWQEAEKAAKACLKG